MKKNSTNRYLLIFFLACFFSTEVSLAQTAVSVASFASTSPTAGTVTFTNPGGTVVIFAKATGAITTGPLTANVSTYTASLVFGSGTASENDIAAFTVFNGTGTAAFNITNLKPNTTYNFLAYNTTAGTTYSAGFTFSGSTPPPPVVTGNLFTATCTDQAQITWAIPSPVGSVLVFAKKGTTAITLGTPTALPSTYTGSLTFGSGTPFENDPLAFCISNSSTATNATIVGLLANTQYEFLFYNVISGVYSTATLMSGSTETVPADVTLGTVTAGNQQVTINWTNPSTCFDDILVIASQTSSTFAAPTLSSYTANSVFATAAALYATGEYNVFFASSGTSVTVTTLANCTLTSFMIYTGRAGIWSAGIAASATPTGGAYSITTQSPTAITAPTTVPTNTALSLVFNQSVTISTTPFSTSTDEQSILIKDHSSGTTIKTIDRSVITGGGTTNVAASFTGSLAISTLYDVIIGDKVFSGCGADLFASPPPWQFMTNPGVTLGEPSPTICPGPYTALGDIVITEVANNNIQGASGVTRNIMVKLPGSGLAFQAGAGSISFASGGDIDNTFIGSPTFTFSTVTFPVKFLNSGDGRSNHDVITISGLKVTGDGSVSTGQVQAALPASPLTFEGLNLGDQLASITVSSGSSVTPTTPVFSSGTGIYCGSATALAGINVSVTATGTVQWYADPGLNSLLFTGNNAPLVGAPSVGLGINPNPSSATTTNIYVTQTTGCQSSPLQIPITVNASPGVSAGTLPTQCSGTAVALGGSPTVSIPSHPSYNYAWIETTGNYTGPALGNVPNPVTNPLNNTTSANVHYNFQVTVTDGNSPSCSGVSSVAFDVTPQAKPILTHPATTFFTTNTPPQALGANFQTTNFTGIGVIQTDATTYSFDPTLAYNPKAGLPQTFYIYFNGVDASTLCPINNYKIDSMTISNSTFTFLQAQYCSDEHPAATSGVNLQLNNATGTSIHAYVNDWNSTERFYYIPYFETGTSYQAGDLVYNYLNNRIYRAVTNYTSSGSNADLLNSGLWSWSPTDGFSVNFTNHVIRNYYEGLYGGPVGPSTIYHPGDSTYLMGTSPNYLNCSACNNAEYPAAYVEFDVYSDIRYYLNQWYSFNYYYAGDVVVYNDRIYQCLQYNPSNYPSANVAPPNGTYWADVTGGKFDQGFLYYDATATPKVAGFVTYGQYVVINPNPPVAFSIVSPNVTTNAYATNNICETDISGTVGLTAALNSNLPALSANRGLFYISYNGGTTWVKDGLSGVVNTTGQTGIATFNSLNAWNATTAILPIYNPSTNYQVGDNVTSGGNTYTALLSGSGNTPQTPSTYWLVNSLTVEIRLLYTTGQVGSTGQSCDSESIQQITIHGAPNLSNTFQSLAPQTFCSTATAISFVATPSDPGMTLSGFGVHDNHSGLATFSPQSAYEQNTSLSPQAIVITAVYTDSFGCSNTTTNNSFVLNPPPVASYKLIDATGNPFLYDATGITPKNSFFSCYNDGPITFQKTIPLNPRYTTKWKIIYDDNDSTFQTSGFSFNPKTFYDDAAANHGVLKNSAATFRIIYISTSSDGANCESQTKQITISVAPVLDVSIAGITDGDVHCSNEGTLPLQLSSPPANSSLNIINNGNSFPQNIPPNSVINYNLDLYLGTVQFVYNVTSGAGGTSCQNPETVTIQVLPSPVAYFKVIPHCVGDSVQYFGADSSKHPMPAKYHWIFTDTDTTTSDLQSPFRKWKTEGNNWFVDLQLSYDIVSGKQCFANNSQLVPPTSLSDHQNQIIGPIPTVDFSFSNVCDGDKTNFIVSTTNGNGQGVTQYKWDFGDGTISYLEPSNIQIISSDPAFLSTTGQYQEPIHSYLATGVYNATLYGSTAAAAGSCPNFKHRTLSILPYISKTQISPSLPYLMDATGGKWFKEDRDGLSTWTFGTASPDGSSPQPAWTNILKDSIPSYHASDHSYVNSPCFDMSEFKQPAIALQYFMNVRSQQDGGVLEYSTTVLNHIQIWKTLGSIGTGQEWYNLGSIFGKPGDDQFNPNSYGWSDKGDVTWINSKHSLDTIPTDSLSKVRFRIAFGSDGGTPLSVSNSGFAFNNVTIVERNRISLIENFTNNNYGSALADDKAFYEFNPGGASTVVKLEYHTSLPTPDSINVADPSDPNARAAFYGLTNSSSSKIPGGFLDGSGPTAPLTGDFSNKWLNNAYKLQSLSPSIVRISINDTDTSKFVVSVKALQDIPTGNLRLLIAAVEETVVGAVTNQFVVRQMYPNAAGTVVTTPLLKGDSIMVTLPQWKFAKGAIQNKAKIGTAAFVQNIDPAHANEVLQAGYLPPNNSVTVITGLDNFADQITIYPVPANKEFLINLPQPVDQDLKITLLNSIGQQIITDDFSTGQKTKTINTKNLADGVYILQLGNRGTVINRRVMVIHQ